MSEIPPPPAVPPSIPPPPGGGSYTPPPPPPPPYGGGPSGSPGSGDRTIMLILSYLGILALIPLLTKKDDPEVQWHAKNGLALFIAEIIIYALISFTVRYVPFLGCGAALVGCVLWIVFVAVWIICIVKALQGQRFRIPVISDFADKM